MQPAQASTTDLRTVVASPNRSATVAQLRRFVGVLSVVSAVVCAFSVVQGNLLAPFFGVLNVATVAWVLRRVWLSADQSDSVSWTGEQVCVDLRRGTRTASAGFHPYWVRLVRRPARRHGDPEQVLLGSHGRFVELGRFLGEERRRRFADEVAALLVIARNGSKLDQTGF